MKIMFIAAILFGQLNLPKEVKVNTHNRFEISAPISEIKCTPENNNWYTLKDINDRPQLIFHPSKTGVYTFIVLTKEQSPKLSLHTIDVIDTNPNPNPNPGPNPNPPTPGPDLVAPPMNASYEDHAKYFRSQSNDWNKVKEVFLNHPTSSDPQIVLNNVWPKIKPYVKPGFQPHWEATLGYWYTTPGVGFKTGTQLTNILKSLGSL